MRQISVPGQALRADLIRLLRPLGVCEADAAAVADALIQAEQWGVASHGVMRVERYVRCLRSGGIRADAPFERIRQHGGWVLTTANGGLGIPASMRAAELAVALAREYGVGAVSVRESHHNGAEGVYSSYMAGQGMLGFAMSTGNAIMAAAGGAEAVIGNNPFSYAAPAGRYGTVMMDAAMSAVADGKVQLARAAGRQLEPGCILDAGGRPSTSPEDYFNGGVLLPFGAHKGYGLAVMVECLAGVLSGAALTTEIDSWNERPDRSGGTGHLLLAFDISGIMPPEAFGRRMEQLIARLKGSRRAEGVQEIYFPGELEQRRQKEAGGRVLLAPPAAEALRRAASHAGVVLQCLPEKEGWDGY